MSVIEEINNQIKLGRSSFRETLENFDDAKWDSSSSSEEWSPKQIAEHTVDAERSFAIRIANAMSGSGPEKVELSLANSQDALEAFNLAVEACDKVIRYVEERDLHKTVDVPESSPLKTIKDNMERIASHSEEHANQIADTVSNS
ncbi:MAG: hypothetical protein CL792_02785 [Chloroflexi bacterium]|nr:hypothetical protein [Chloroflexota bacterium]|tara:strand:+ start:2186 stop:2620 length:435 start_codon:yes stop_codon:yes gene_type:complete